jgi:hypothetical protein
MVLNGGTFALFSKNKKLELIQNKREDILLYPLFVFKTETTFLN